MNIAERPTFGGGMQVPNDLGPMNKMKKEKTDVMKR